MQEIQPLVDSILEEARQEAEAFRAQGRAAAKEVRGEYQARAAEQRQKLIQQAEERAKEEKERKKIQAQLDMGRDLLEMKGDFIDRVFQLVQKRLSEMDPVDYQRFMKDLLLGAVETGDEELRISAQARQRLGKDFLPQINNALKSAGKKGALTYSAEPLTSDGFILSRGKVVHNYTIENLVASKKEELTPEIAKRLFG